MARANTTPATVSANHERRIRPALPSGAREPDDRQRDRHPLDVARPPMDEAVEVGVPELVRETRPSQERVLRRVDLERRGSGSNGQQSDPERSPRHRGRPPPGGPPRAGRSARRSRRRRGGSRRTPRGTADARDPRRRAPPRRAPRPARPTVQQRSGREERGRRDQVRDVAGGQVHRERARQQPRERGAGCLRAPPHEGGRGEADRHAQRDLERRGRLDDREPERPLEDERERRRSGPIRDRRQALDTREPGPPEVDGRIRAHRECSAARDERPQEPQEQDDGEGRDQERVGPACASVRDATPVR